MAILEVQLGRFERVTSARAYGATRWVEIVDCSIVKCDVDLDNDVRDSPLRVSILERDIDQTLYDNPLQIGQFWPSDPCVELHFHPDAFAEIWAACKSGDSVTRIVRVSLEQDHPNAFAVMQASLIEKF